LDGGIQVGIPVALAVTTVEANAAARIAAAKDERKRIPKKQTTGGNAMKKANKGFTLIELMIVVAIIAIIAAIAIPNLLRSRMQSNESSAIGNLRTIVGAEVAYHAANYEYTAAFADLTGATPSFLDGNWDGTKSGYNFVLGGDANNFTANANAAVYGTTGGKGFFTDSSGVIRYADGADADAASDPIGE